MDSEKLDRIALLLENMDKNFMLQFDRLEKKVDKIEQDISVLKQQNADLQKRSTQQTRI